MAVPALKGTIKSFTNAVAKMAKENKRFAEELVFENGIRGEITPKALKPLLEDQFTRTGKLTSAGKEDVKDLIKEYGLPKNATWYEILQKYIVESF